MTNPYFSLQGSGGAFSFLAFDPTGKGSYGPNLLAGSGLLFQFQGDGIPIDAISPATVATSGQNSLQLDIPVTTSFVVAQEQQNNGWDLAEGGPASQSFTWPGGVLSEVGIGLFSANGSSRPTGPATVALISGGASGTQVAKVTLDPGDLAQLQGSGGELTYVAFAQPDLPAGTYTVTVESSDPLWAVLYQSPVSSSPGTLVLGNNSYTDRAMQFGVVAAGNPVLAVDQSQQNNGYDIHFGNGVAQTFVAPSTPVSAIGLGLFSAFGRLPVAPLQVSILSGGPTGQSVFSTTLSPEDLAQISGGPNMSFVASGVLQLTPGATYAISLQSSDATWAALYQQGSGASPYPEGELYLGGQPKANAALMFSLVSTQVETLYQATWSLQAVGPRLESQLSLTAPASHQVSAAGFSITTPWEQDGYDVTNPATTPLSRFYDSEGEYLPIQEFKRRPALFGEFSFDIGSGSIDAAAGARKWIHASGQNGYDLRFAWDDICCHFEMSSSTFTFLFFQTGYKPPSQLVTTLPAGGSLSYPFNVTVSPAEGKVPD